MSKVNPQDQKRAETKKTTGLPTEATYWATPKANDAEKRGNVTLRPGLPELVGQAQSWPTPRSTDGEKGGPNQHGSKGDLMLPSAAAQWPTPSARDWRSEEGTTEFVSKRLSETRGQTLSFTAVHSLHQAQPINAGPTSSETTPSTPRRLNPIFAEWLMGWPSQWTKAEPSASSASATASWRSALQQHLSSLLAEPACEPHRKAA